MSSSYGSPSLPTGVPAQTSGKAIASLVLGLLSFVTCLLTGIPAIILGVLGLSNISKSQGRLKGRGLAMTGIITGSIGTLISIPAILAALALPALQSAREMARRNVSANNMAQIAKSMFGYELNRQEYPTNIVDADGKPLLSWRVKMLPMLDQQALYKKFHLDEPWDSPHNKQLLAEMPEEFRNPNLPNNDGTTTYLLPVGPGTMFESHQAEASPTGRPKGMSSNAVQTGDGVSQTIMLVEADEDQAVPWTKPADLIVDRNNPWRGLGDLRPLGFLAVFGDTRAMFISTDVPPATLNKAFSWNGKQFNEGPLNPGELED